MATVATLETFIIDTFTRIDNGVETPVDKPDQIGGAGSYAIVGARTVLAPSALTMIVDHTPATLPAHMRAKLESFGHDMWAWRTRTDGHGTTRAKNAYDGEVRGFEYLSPPIDIYPADLPPARRPDWVHIVSYPARTRRALAELRAAESTGWRASVIWEPEPPCCTPEYMRDFAELTPQVDIISPNHTELLALHGLPPSPAMPDLVAPLEFLTRSLARLAPRVAAVVRAGPLGCCYVLRTEYDAYSAARPHDRQPEPDELVPVHWGAAFFGPQDAGRVRDPTGGGNAFAGALAAALAQGRDVNEAIILANVAASFVIEQDGVPELTVVDGIELWNGEQVAERVRRLTARVRGE
ncbi:hypothetical protein Q5752_002431 [Cryptotrichosporon argae]